LLPCSLTIVEEGR